MQIEIRRADGFTERRSLGRDTTLKFGSGSLAHVACSGDGIRGVHCGILFKHGRFEVRTAKGAQPVLVNGEAVEKSPLRAGDIIEIGDVRIEVFPADVDLEFAPLEEDGSQRGAASTQVMTPHEPPRVSATADADFHDLDLAPLDENRAAVDEPSTTKPRRADAWSQPISHPSARSANRSRSKPSTDSELFGDALPDLELPLSNDARDESELASPDSAKAARGKSARRFSIDVRRLARSKASWAVAAIAATIGAALGVVAWINTLPTADDVLDRADAAFVEKRYGDAFREFEAFLARVPDSRRAPRVRMDRGLARIYPVTAAAEWRRALEFATELLAAESPRAAHDPRVQALLEAIAAATLAHARELRTPDSLSDARTAVELLASLYRERNASEAAATLACSKFWRQLIAVERDAMRDRIASEWIARIANGKVSDDQEMGDLLALWPELRSHPEFARAAQALGNSLAAAVTYDGAVRAATTEPAPSIEIGSLALARRRGPPPATNPDHVVALFDEAAGAVVACDVASGRLLWRRFIGWDAPWQPRLVHEAVGAAGRTLLIDSISRELVCVDAATGRLAWRASITDNALPPVLAGDHVFIADESGALTIYEVSSGAMVGAFQLPQRLVAGPAVDMARGVCYQPAATGFVYTLSITDKICRGASYLGHAPGAATIEPVLLDDLLVISEEGGAAKSSLRIYRIHAKTGELAFVQSIPIAGRVERPLAVVGERIAVGETGGWLVARRDRARQEAPLEIERQEPSPQPNEVATSIALDATGKAYVAHTGLSVIELAGTAPFRLLASAERSFCYPMQVISGAIIVGERMAEGTLRLSAFGIGGGDERWRLEFDAPIWIAAAGNPQRFAALDARGGLFDVSLEDLSRGARVRDVPAATLDLPRALPSSSRAVRFSTATVVSPGPGEDFLVSIDPNALTGRVIRLLAPLTSHAVRWEEMLVVPLANGMVGLYDPRTLEPLALPFQPPLAFDEPPKWSSPRVLEDGRLAIDDGRGQTYALARSTDREPALVAVEPPQSSTNSIAETPADEAAIRVESGRIETLAGAIQLMPAPPARTSNN